jgi:guanylate kinase
MIELPVRSLLVVVSAPSGGGKTTLCERLMAEFHPLVYSVSCTTRAPRDGEQDGTDYYFISESEFQRRVEAGEFLEHAVVHGHRYGTLRRFVEKGFASGRDVLMDIDVQGASQIRDTLRTLPENDALRRGFVDIFIAPPSIEVLRKRLLLRGKDSDIVIERRLQQAEKELLRWPDYRYLIVNDRLDASYDQLRSIIVAEHRRVRADVA